MAAAIAAAAEYGRCNGVENAFEPLRRLPLDLAEEEDGSVKTKMLRLFQPSLGVRRLFDLFLVAVAWHEPRAGLVKGCKARRVECRAERETANRSGGRSAILPGHR